MYFDADGLERLGDLDCVVLVEAAVDPVLHRHPRAEHQAGHRFWISAATTSTISRMRFSSEPPQRSVRCVGQRRQELVQQVAMRAMQFDEVEAGALGAAGRRHELADQGLDLRLVQRMRHLPARVEGDRRGRHDLATDPRPAWSGPPPSQGRWFEALRPAWASWTPNLVPGCGHAAGGVERTLGGRLVVVRIEAEAAMRDAAVPLDVGHLDGHHAGAREREVGPVIEMPVARRAVVGRILAHRCDGDAIRELQRAEGDRCKQMRGHAGSGKRIASALCKPIAAMHNPPPGLRIAPAGASLATLS